jgi:hypothetical protein
MISFIPRGCYHLLISAGVFILTEEIQITVLVDNGGGLTASDAAFKLGRQSAT